MSDFTPSRLGLEELLNDGDRFRPLLEEQWPALSIYCSTDPDQRDVRAHEARLRQSLDEAERSLRALPDAEQAGGALMERARSVCASIDFAEHRDPCLVLLLSPQSAHLVSAPIGMDEGVQVARHFHLKPLLPFLTRNRHFHVLAVSAGNAKLFTATPFSWSERPLDQLPMDAEAEFDSLPASDFAPGSGQSAEDARKALMLEDMRRVAAAVRSALGTDPAPVVLAAEPNTAGHFPALAHLPQILDEKLLLNPFAIPPAELHAKALGIMEPLLDQDAETVLDQVNARLGTAEPTVSLRLEEILMAAHEGRVDAVAVASDRLIWGRYEPGRTVEAHGHPVPGDEDLLNHAAVLSLRNGARAFSLPAARLPRQAPAAAIFHY